MAGIAPMNRNHGKRPRLTAIDEASHALNVRYAGFFELLPERGGTQRDGKIALQGGLSGGASKMIGSFL